MVVKLKNEAEATDQFYYCSFTTVVCSSTRPRHVKHVREIRTYGLYSHVHHLGHDTTSNVRRV